MSRKAVLITGGGGFIGSHLAESYIRNDWDVICVDHFLSGLESNRTYLEKLHSKLNLSGKIKSQFYFIKADVTQDWVWLNSIPDDVLKSVKFVFHLASPASPVRFQKLALETMWVNSIGLERALRFSDSVRARLIFSSTSEIYGDPSVSPQSESYWGNVNSFGPRSCYDESKRFGEALIYNWNQNYKTKHGLVRIFNTYGPRMNPADGRVIIQFLGQCLNSNSFTIFGSGQQTRCFCYVEDMIEGLIRYSESGVCIPVNLGSDQEITILKLAKMINELCGHNRMKIEFKDLPQDDPQRRRPDIRLAFELLSGWRPSVSLPEGIQRTYSWLQSEYQRSEKVVELL